MTQQAAKTGSGPTVTVAIEQFFPPEQRIIHDDLAYQIVPLSMRAFIGMMRFNVTRDWMVRLTEKAAPGIWSGVMCRKRYIDEKLLESAGQIKAIVNLGAGYDTRLYRFPQLADIPAWEVDQPGNIASKLDTVQKIFGKVPAHVKLVPIDFDHESLEAVLTDHGYELGQPTFFIWEAVTQYLTETGIRATFDFLAQAVSGSRLAFTYICQEFLDGSAMSQQYKRLYKAYVDKGIWLFGLDPDAVAAFLDGYGWRLIEDVGYDELAERYVKPLNRDLPSMPIERMVYAQKV